MPTYVYACAECGAQFEQFQRFSDEPLTTCPRCQGSVRRVFQPVGIVFKGSGWYITDSRKSSSASTSPSEPAKPAASAADDSSPAKSAESAPAAESASAASSASGGSAAQKPPSAPAA